MKCPQCRIYVLEEHNDSMMKCIHCDVLYFKNELIRPARSTGSKKCNICNGGYDTTYAEHKPLCRRSKTVGQ